MSFRPEVERKYKSDTGTVGVVFRDDTVGRVVLEQRPSGVTVGWSLNDIGIARDSLVRYAERAEGLLYARDNEMSELHSVEALADTLDRPEGLQFIRISRVGCLAIWESDGWSHDEGLFSVGAPNWAIAGPIVEEFDRHEIAEALPQLALELG